MKKTPFCPHLSVCPGCHGRDIDFPQALKELQAFFALRKLEVSYTVGNKELWRSRAKLAVRAKGKSFSIGLFQTHSHDIVEIPLCRAHTQALSNALEVVCRAMKEEPSLSYYDELHHSGALRYLLLSEETTSGKVSIGFVLNLSPLTYDAWKHFSTRLFSSFPDLFHSFWLNFQPEKINRIVSDTWKHICGEVWQWERFGSLLVPFSLRHFRQANLPLFEQLLFDVKEHIPRKTRVVDLFCGMGVIGLFLADISRKVTCVEVERSAQESFEEAKRKLRPELQNTISFIPISCEEGQVGALLSCCETVIVDPPRKGLSLSLMQTIVASKSITTLVYISCSVPSLLSNSRFLLDNGFLPKVAKAYQFFPGTEHIESMVIYEKSG